MNCKRFRNRIVLALVLALAAPLLPASQETPAKPATQDQTPPQTKDQTADQAPVLESKLSAPVFSYDSEGRRDPFKDLFGGKEVKDDKKIITGLIDMEISDITLMGIVKTPARYEAIVAFADGFPLTLLEGQKLADGFVLSIDAGQVVFRKTSDKGIPLSKPKDVIKEISPEEPAHD